MLYEAFTAARFHLHDFNFLIFPNQDLCIAVLISARNFVGSQSFEGERWKVLHVLKFLIDGNSLFTPSKCGIKETCITSEAHIVCLLKCWVSSFHILFSWLRYSVLYALLVVKAWKTRYVHVAKELKLGRFLFIEKATTECRFVCVFFSFLTPLTVYKEWYLFSFETKKLRKKSSLHINQLIYEKLPSDISERHVLLMDPVLGTGNFSYCFPLMVWTLKCIFSQMFLLEGNSASQAIELLIQKGVPESHIIFLNLISVSW